MLKNSEKGKKLIEQLKKLKKAKLITNPNHYIITSPHPSPFSARNGFFGSKPFSKANNYLKSKGLKEIDWDLN